MRFFTPELYLRYNSDDDAVANEANEEWEAALEGYTAHVGRLKNFLLAGGIEELINNCFHDATIFGSNQVHVPPFLAYSSVKEVGYWVHSAVYLPPFSLALTLRGKVWMLNYSLWAAPRVNQPVQEWPTKKAPVVWLYDELDTVWEGSGLFAHRMLLSTGAVWEIPFTFVSVFGLPLPAVVRPKVPETGD
jgi:hypothetical protein